MRFERPIICLAAITAFTAAFADENPRLLGSVHSGTYGDASYEEIDAVELRSYSALMAHPHQVVISGTDFGDWIACSLYGSDGEAIATVYENSASGETSVFFTEYIPRAPARCFTVTAERLTRPSSG